MRQRERQGVKNTEGERGERETGVREREQKRQRTREGVQETEGERGNERDRRRERE